MTDTADQPVHPGVRPGDHDVRPRPGHRAVGRQRQALPRLPRRPRRDLARPRQPGDRRGAGRTRATRCCTSATCSPTTWRSRRPTSSTGLLGEVTGEDGQVFFCNSGAEANEAALKLARKFGGRGRHAVVSAYGSFHGRTLATLAATGQPAKHEPFFPMPDGFRHVAFDDLDALDRGGRPERQRRPARADPGRGRRDPRRSRLPARRARPVRRARPAADHRRGADRDGPRRDVVRLRARRDRPRRRHDGQGDRQRLPGRRGVGQARRRRRLPARRPRQHLQRHGAGHRRWSAR